MEADSDQRLDHVLVGGPAGLVDPIESAKLRLGQGPTTAVPQGLGRPTPSLRVRGVDDHLRRRSPGGAPRDLAVAPHEHRDPPLRVHPRRPAVPGPRGRPLAHRQVGDPSSERPAQGWPPAAAAIPDVELDVLGEPRCAPGRVVQGLQRILERARRLVPRDVVGQRGRLVDLDERQAEVGRGEETLAAVADRRRIRGLLGPVDLIEHVRVGDGLRAQRRHRLLHGHLDGAGHELGPSPRREIASALADRALIVRPASARPDRFAIGVALGGRPANRGHQSAHEDREVHRDERHPARRRLGTRGHLVGQLVQRPREERGHDERTYRRTGAGRDRCRAGKKGGPVTFAGPSRRGLPGARCASFALTKVNRIRDSLGSASRDSWALIHREMSRVPMWIGRRVRRRA